VRSPWPSSEGDATSAGEVAAQTTCTVLLAIAVVAILVPTLLYYGGGWLQYGYRYFLDSIPFLWAMVAMWLARRRGGMPWWGWTLVFWGVLVGLGGVYWAYNLH
jgi:hypothetical protein